MISGVELERLLYGNILDAFGTELFGVDTTRSDDSLRNDEFHVVGGSSGEIRGAVVNEDVQLVGAEFESVLAGRAHSQLAGANRGEHRAGGVCGNGVAVVKRGADYELGLIDFGGDGLDDVADGAGGFVVAFVVFVAATGVVAGGKGRGWRERTCSDEGAG